MEKVDIKSMDITELQELLRELGEPKFRAKQLFDWLHAKQVDSFAEMTNLSKSLRESLAKRQQSTAWKSCGGWFRRLTARENIFLRFRMAQLSKVY